MNSTLRNWLRVFALLIVVSKGEAGEKARTPGSEIIGTYFNEGKTLVEVHLLSKDGREGAVIPLSAGRIDRALITEGQIKIYTPSDQIAKRRLLSTMAIPTPKTAPAFFEEETRTFYFRIAAGKVMLVKPKELTASERKRLNAAIRELQKAGVYNNGR